MDTKEKFKDFVRQNPVLLTHVKEGKMTWQKFYEIYDIYGEEESAWQDYFAKEKTNNDYNFKSITDKIKNLDLSSIQEHIGTAQKALGIVQELTSKGTTTTGASKVADAVNPRPINKIFED